MTFFQHPASDQFESLPIGIRRLIACLLNKAHDELARIDPEYVRNMESIRDLESIDLAVPNALYRKVALPSARLPDEWHRLLESIYDLYSSIKRLQLNAELLEQPSPDPENLPIGALVDFYEGSWWPNAQAVVEKAIILIKSSLRRFSIARAEQKQIEAELTKQLVDRQSRLGQRRNPDLHGGRGTLFEELTKDGLWELSVALQASPSVTVTREVEHAERRREFRSQITQRNTALLVDEVATVFGKLADALGCDEIPPVLHGGKRQ